MAILWFETDISRRDALALKFDNIPLHDWGLSTRTLNALLRHNPSMSVGDVIRADESIAKIQNLGKKCIKELDSKVSQLLAKADDNIEAWLSTIQPSARPTPVADSKPSPKFLPESARKLSIDQLHLNVRTHNALLRAGIATIGELYDMSRTDLRYLGVGSEYCQSREGGSSCIVEVTKRKKRGGLVTVLGNSRDTTTSKGI